MRVLNLQCRWWEDWRYVECISQHLICKAEWWRSQKKWEGKTTTNAQTVFTEILVWARQIHPFARGNHITGNATFYCFRQCYRGNLSTINRFSAIFPVCWPEPGFSLMLNINILALLLFSSCINELSTGSGKRYLLLCFRCDNVKKPHARCFPKGHLCPDEHPYRKHNCILLKKSCWCHRILCGSIEWFTAPVMPSFSFCAVLMAIHENLELGGVSLCGIGLKWARSLIFPFDILERIYSRRSCLTFSILHVKRNLPA